jgi:DNA-binding CsgD family transcriptional regulator
MRAGGAPDTTRTRPVPGGSRITGLRSSFPAGEGDRPFLIQSYRNAIECARLQTELDERRQELLLPLADPRLTRALTAHGITAREAEILSWVATGRSDRAIGRQTNLRERTVQTHLHRCYRKMISEMPWRRQSQAKLRGAVCVSPTNDHCHASFTRMQQSP